MISMLFPRRSFSVTLSLYCRIFRRRPFPDSLLSLLPFSFPPQCLLISAGPNLTSASLFTSYKFSRAMCFSYRVCTIDLRELYRCTSSRESLGSLESFLLLISRSLAEWYFCLSCIQKMSGNLLLCILQQSHCQFSQTNIPTPFIIAPAYPLCLYGLFFCPQCSIRMEGLSANKIIMLKYSPLHPARVNPEFIGIATKFGNIKKNRTSLERDRDELSRKLKYRISVDRHLDKTLEENRGKLRTVTSVHRRHQDEQEQKRAREERHHRDMISLNHTVQMTREQQRQNIRDALSRTQSRNRQSRGHCGQMTTLMESQLRSTEMCRLEEKRLRFKEIKLVERDSQNTVHQFYRERNNGSLNHYQSQIQEERSKHLQFVEEIKKIESSIDHYDAKIDKKKEKLVEVLDQISLYTMESVDTQARCLPLYLRDNLSTSTHSSKPSDILLRGPRSIINDL